MIQPSASADEIVSGVAIMLVIYTLIIAGMWAFAWGRLRTLSDA